MRSLVLFALLSALPLAADSPPEKGTLCFVEKNDRKCSATEGLILVVTASEARRRFVWTDTDGKRAVIGSVEPNATSISIDDKALSEVSLGIRGDRRRGWPTNARVTLSAKEEEWGIPLSAKVVEKLTAIRMPAGTYRMSIAADHHITEKRTLNVSKNVALREVNLKPLPLISGRVISVKEEPIAGAQITRTDGKVQATTNEQGFFQSELFEPLPDQIIVTQPHFASTVVPLGDLKGEVDLGTIHLGAGMKLTLHLVRPDIEDMPLHVGLFEKNPRKYEHTRIAERDLKAKENDISFSDLGSGTYFVVIEGKDPLQRFSKDFDIKDSEVEKEIRIAPFRLDGSVRVGDEPVRNGSIELQDLAHSWRTGATIDESGHFGGSMWQKGKVLGWINGAGIAELVESPELGSDPSVWDVVFKRRYIRGRIFDEETNEPVERVSLRLQITSGQSRSYIGLDVQPDGRYSLLAVKNGMYELRAEAPGHVPGKATVNVAEESADRQLDFPLARGVQQVVEFTWPSSERIANAQVLEGINSDGYNPERLYSTEGAGRLALNLRRGETKTLYILPSEGSFAVVHVIAPDKLDADPRRVVVPLPAAALRVEMRDANDKLVPGIVVFRFNGELIPQPAIQRLPMEFVGTGNVRIRNLPAGAYEIWAVTLRGDYSPLIGRTPSRPPTRVGLTAGEQSVKLLAGPLD